MQSVNRALILVLMVGFVAVGCKEIESLKRTGEVPDKMDQTNSKMDKTNEKLDDTYIEMKKTGVAIHRQELIIPLLEMLKRENWNPRVPVPFKLIPFGQAFAEAATAKELTELTYLWLKEIREVGPDAEMQWDGNEKLRSEAEARALFEEKLTKLTILQVIAGFTPDATVQKIMQKELNGNDEVASLRHQLAAKAFMALRARFISDVLLRNSVMSENLTNVGEVEDAIGYVRKLDLLATNSMAQEFKFKVSGTIKYAKEDGTAQSYEYEFADELPSGQDAPKAWWEKIKYQLETSVVIPEVSVSASGEVQAQHARLLSRKERAAREVAERIQYWQRVQ